MNKAALKLDTFDIALLPLIQHPYIETVKDDSDDSYKRIRIHFKNGMQLSVVRGPYSYGGEQGLFEIAALDRNDDWFPELWDEEDAGDCVLGYCDIDKVNHYIQRLGTWAVTVCYSVRKNGRKKWYPILG
ncbi:MAG: hypothetical protein LUQ26_05340 [Methylococcaceae bacterium]|nr:hypothetical protein [Methylococcaceae bacterium]